MIKNKLIIHNQTDLSDLEALEYVKEVIKLGRVSSKGESYCLISIFKPVNGVIIGVFADRNKKSDSFKVWQVKEI